MPPNVVLICVDQWRGDCLSGAGHPVVMTPYLDGWMSTGTRFTHAYSATPTCVPARAALFTGLAQENHGRVGYRDGVPWRYPVTMAGEFSRRGYQTQSVGKMHVYPERQSMGFEDVALHDGYMHFGRREHYEDPAEVDDYLPWLRERMGYPEADYAEHGVDCNSVVARPWDKPEYTHPTNWIATRSVQFLRERDTSRPFFLYASFHRPHPPYDPPAWAFEQYLNEEMPEPPVGGWADELAEYGKPGDPSSAVAKLPARMLQRARAGYYGHMSHIDQQISRLFEELRASGEWQNTVVCFVSDHGEQMGDHNLFRKSLPYEGSARVPFIIAGPGVPSGTVCDDVVELRDVMPTLLDAAGLPVPDSIDGRSALSAARGNAASWRRYIHGEHVAFGQSVQWVTDGREKYIWFSGRGIEQYFDLTTDPHEETDLAGEASCADRVAVWRNRLVEELADRPEGFVQDGRLVTGRPVDALIPDHPAVH